ncbi:MAG: cytochrome P450 [Proteobacteria bacterium]|nr:cytochrome P450 [Pseudomonadota bacterium]
MRLLQPGMIDDPYPSYAHWQANHPIWQDDQTGHWVLTRHTDVHQVLRNHAQFSSAAMGNGGNPLPLLSDDPPRHTELRGIVNRAFTSRMLKKMESTVSDIADEMILNVDAGKPLDIVKALTIPLPVVVISRMMGIPEERMDDFKHWSDAMTGTLAGATKDELMSAVMEMAAFFQGLIPERRANPGDDLVSAVVNSEVDGKTLSDNDIIGFNILLLIAGNETTTNLLGNLLNVLQHRPELWQELRAHPERIDAAIEELLRYDSPVQFLMRTATQDMEFYGQPVAAGENVTVITGAANRDPRVFEAPQEFNLARPKGRHFSLGFGIHFCIGAPPARLEARTAMTALLAKFDGVEPGVGESRRVQSQLLRGFEKLPLKFG